MNAASRFIDAKVARQGALFFLSFTTLVLSTSGAYAADTGKASNEISFLVALLALVLVGRLIGRGHESHRAAVGHGATVGRYPIGAFSARSSSS